MRLQQIMETSVDTIPADLPAQQAWDRMRLRRIHHLVVTRGHEVIGIVSERDLGGRGGAPMRSRHSVADLMTDTVVVATPNTTLKQAANLMRGRSIGCLPVMDGNRLAGIVTITDLLEALGKGVERPVETSTRWVMAGRGHRQRHYTGR